MKSNNANNKYYNRDMEGFYGTKKKKSNLGKVRKHL